MKRGRQRLALRGGGAAALLLAAALTLLAAPASAADGTGADGPPPPGPPRALVLPPLHELVLANGLTAIVAERRGVPLVTVSLVLRAGAESDPPRRAGVAAATAALVTRGATRGGRPVDASALARQAEALGASLDGASGWTTTAVSMTVAAPRLDAALALVADVVRRPLLARDELERWRAQALDDLDLLRADPSAVAAQVARRLHWGASAYGAVPTAASLQRITREDVVAFHRRAARPDRALLVFAGDVGADRALALARRHFGDWRAPAAEATTPVATARPLPLHNVVVDMPGAGQSSVLLAAPWVASGDAELRVAQVAAAVLGGGYSSRLNQAVRIRRGLSYGVAADAEAYAGDGWWTASAQTAHATAAQVLQLLRDEVERLRHEAPAAAELAARQAAMVGAFARRWETSAGTAALLAAQWAGGRPWRALATYPADVLAVDAGQVRDFAARRWRADALRAVVVGDLEAAGDTLPVAAGSAWWLPLRELDFDQPGMVAEPP